MVSAKGYSASTKEIIVLFGLLIGFILILPYLLKQVVKSTASNAADLVKEGIDNVSASIQPKLDSIALGMMPQGIKQVTAIIPTPDPGQFPTTINPVLGKPESQPYVDWLRGSSNPGDAYILTPEQSEQFLDPWGDAMAEERIQQGLAMMEEQNKPWYQFW